LPVKFVTLGCELTFETAAKHDKPVLLHPARTTSLTDYATEDKSKYEIWWTFGWPYEASATMARMVFSGPLDRLPDLNEGPGRDWLGALTSDEDHANLLKSLKKRPRDHFDDFYADSATFGSRSATVCGLDFSGENLPC
jgi:hypothetical protein